MNRSNFYCISLFFLLLTACTITGIPPEQSSAVEINQTIDWLVKASESIIEFYDLVNAEDLTGAKVALNPIPIYLDEAERTLTQARKTSVTEEMRLIDLLDTYVKYLRKIVVMNGHSLDALGEFSKIEVSENIEDIGTYLTIGRQSVAKARSTYEEAVTLLDSMKLEHATPDLRVAILTERSYIQDNNYMFTDLEQFFNGFRKYLDGLQRFTKIENALAKEDMDAALEHVRASRQLISESSQIFSSLTSSKNADIATGSVAIKSIISKIDDVLAIYEDAFNALARGNEAQGLALLEEAVAAAEAIDI